MAENEKQQSITAMSELIAIHFDWTYWKQVFRFIRTGSLVSSQFSTALAITRIFYVQNK